MLLKKDKEFKVTHDQLRRLFYSTNVSYTCTSWTWTKQFANIINYKYPRFILNNFFRSNNISRNARCISDQFSFWTYRPKISTGFSLFESKIIFILPSLKVADLAYLNVCKHEHYEYVCLAKLYAKLSWKSVYTTCLKKIMSNW